MVSARIVNVSIDHPTVISKGGRVGLNKAFEVLALRRCGPTRCCVYKHQHGHHVGAKSIRRQQDRGDDQHGNDSESVQVPSRPSGRKGMLLQPRALPASG